MLEPLRSRQPWRPIPWLLWAGVLLYALFVWLSTELSVMLRVPSDSPGDNPPWYFIRENAVHGLSLLGYFLSCAAIGAVAMRKGIEGGAMLIWFSLIWSFIPVWEMAVIFLKTDHLFDPVRARTSWPTYDSYRSDPYMWGWVVVLIALLFLLRRVREGSGGAE